MYQKDFQGWLVVKEKIHGHQSSLFRHEGEVWWSSIGCNIGSESDGKGKQFYRPVLIIKTWGPDLCLGIPLTSKIKEGRYYMNVSIIGRASEGFLMLSQIRVLDTKRLGRKMGSIHKDQLRLVKEKLIALIK